MPKELLMSSSTYDQGEDFTYDQGHTVASATCSAAWRSSR